MNAVLRADTITDWIEETCERHRDSVAATGEGETLTFGEFWSRSIRVAHELVARGVRPEDRVGLWAEQGSDLLVGMAGIMAAGAAYVPLDPSYPKSRLEYFVSDAALHFVVAPDRLLLAASELGIPVISTTPLSIGEDPVGPLPTLNEHNAAYVIYTSGSTGRPKGVVIEHQSVMHLLRWMIADCGLQPGDRVMGTASPAFDASVPNFLLPLVTGGTFVALSTETTRDPYALAEAIIRYHPRALQASPTMLRMLSETRWRGDKDLEIWTGGERTAASVIRYIAPRVRSLCNYYGPTEATVQVTMARLGPDDIDSPVGTPPDHVECVLLDPGGQPTPVGETGELFIIGTALARGYINDPILTAKLFAPIVHGRNSPQRAYRTGDLARIREDNSLLILGRVDDQIKLRGYRIEPGEIERRLMEHPQIIDATVLSQQANDSDEPRLIAFVKSTGPVDAQSMRTFARQTLPDYMVPAVFIELEEFPLTPNGKVDKAQLTDVVAADKGRSPNGPEVPSSDVVPSELEGAVREMFASVLSINIEKVGVDDDFFDLGGTSLRCARLFISIEERYGVTLPLSTIVTASTVRDLADAIDGHVLAGRSPSTSDEPPRHEWERVLCNLWSEMLGVSDVSRSDNFFDLGGSASDASRMIEQMKTVCGTEVSLPELYRAPTVAQLAALTGGRSSRATLVPLNTTGANTPFFCIAGVGGLALAFLPLSRLLGPEQPFYGLQAHGIESRGLPDFTLHRTATRYAKAIREVQPHGPYLIGGHSLGGALALMVAQQLSADGEEVALLAIFDTLLSERMTGTRYPVAGGAVRHSHSWRVFQVRPKLSTVLRLPLAGLVPQKGMAQFDLFGLHGTIQARFASRLGSWSGRTAVYQSDDTQSANLGFGWGCLLTGTWSRVAVPGDHLSMMQRSNVTLLAKNLRHQIDEALSSSRPASVDLGVSALPHHKKSIATGEV